MVRRVERQAEGRDVVADRRARVDVSDEDRLDLPGGVGPQARLDRDGVDRASLTSMHLLHPHTHHGCHLAPDDGEGPGREHEHEVAPGQGVGQGHLPGSVTVGDRHEGTACRPGDRGELLEDGVRDVDELTRVDVRHGPVHGGEHPVRDD